VLNIIVLCVRVRKDNRARWVSKRAQGAHSLRAVRAREGTATAATNTRARGGRAWCKGEDLPALRGRVVHCSSRWFSLFF
jgi:hypothetical protein